MGAGMTRPELMLLEVAVRAGGMLLGAAKEFLKIKQAEFERTLEKRQEGNASNENSQR